jgi:hypothetical protein
MIGIETQPVCMTPLVWTIVLIVLVPSAAWASGPNIALERGRYECIPGVPLFSDLLIVGTSTVLPVPTTRHYCHDDHGM